jgi:hypothetical protein
MEFGVASKVELVVVLVGLLGLCRALYSIISRDRENTGLCGEPPVRLTLGRRLQVALNPGRLHKWSWTPARATVKKTFLVRRDLWATVASDPIRVAHPWKIARRYGFGVWYKYTIGSTTYWGEHRPFISYRTEKEARERADALLEAEISIRFDPDLPEDSRPVFEQSPLFR